MVMDVADAEAEALALVVPLIPRGGVAGSEPMGRGSDG